MTATAPLADPATPPPSGNSAPLRRKLVWVAALSFASGFPYGVFVELLPTYFRVRDVGLAEIGAVAALGGAWTFKFLWAPLIDRTGTRKGWIIGSQLLLAVVLASLTTLDVSSISTTVWLLLAALVALSATQDVAIDAYTIELLDERELGAANGIRVTAYRVALIAAGGGFVALGGLIGWRPVFGAAAALMVAIAVMTATLPSPPVLRAHVSGFTATMKDAVWNPLQSLLSQRAMWGALIFILLFKLGDFALTPMVRPFWIDSGFSPEQIGLVLGTVGVLATIGGALLGGALTTRWGIFTALWALGLTQALSNLGYWLAARTGAPENLMYGAAIIEQLTYGLGTAAFLAFLMSVAEKRYAATQFALLTAIFGLSRTIAATVSGVGAERLGYESYFLLTFALAFPGFLFLPFARRVLRSERPAESTASLV